MSAAPKPSLEPKNYHACLVRLESKGVLITGPSGAGKSSLAFGLMEAFKRQNKTAFLVSDDQVNLYKCNNQLTGEAPPEIAGKAEIFGFGIVQIDNIAFSDIHLIVQLEKDELIERMPEAEITTLLGIELPVVAVPERHETHSVRIVLAKFSALFD